MISFGDAVFPWTVTRKKGSLCKLYGSIATMLEHTKCTVGEGALVHPHLVDLIPDRYHDTFPRVDKETSAWIASTDSVGVPLIVHC